MLLGDTFEITPDELKAIFIRLQPYLPPYLKKVNTRSWGLEFEFAPFTGREEQPAAPLTGRDPNMSYVPETENRAEHLFRRKAGVILANVYEAANAQWANAAYIADLKTVVQDAPALWQAYQRETKALEAAYGHLRTPEAAREWPSAVSRLIDAQDSTRTAADAFDGRAEEIARVQERHLYSEMGRADALKAAGYPETGDWHIVSAYQYDRSGFGGRNDRGLGSLVRRLIERQDAHVAKIARMSGYHPQLTASADDSGHTS